jgi:hypothetical protein
MRLRKGWTGERLDEGGSDMFNRRTYEENVIDRMQGSCTVHHTVKNARASYRRRNWHGHGRSSGLQAGRVHFAQMTSDTLYSHSMAMTGGLTEGYDTLEGGVAASASQFTCLWHPCPTPSMQ